VLMEPTFTTITLNTLLLHQTLMCTDYMDTPFSCNHSSVVLSLNVTEIIELYWELCSVQVPSAAGQTTGHDPRLVHWPSYHELLGDDGTLDSGPIKTNY